MGRRAPRRQERNIKGKSAGPRLERSPLSPRGPRYDRGNPQDRGRNCAGPWCTFGGIGAK